MRHEIDDRDERPVLIFPGGMPRSLDFLQRCLREKQAVIGASSLDYDVSRNKYPSWLHLPFVTAPEFNDALAHAIRKFDICGIYSPNPVVWAYLNQTLNDIAPGIRLVNDSPVNEELGGFRAALARAREISERPLMLASCIAAKSVMSEIEAAAIFWHADRIPGMCDHEKLHALCEVARHSVSGDIVEIGSWWGKSAFILARLARCYQIGNLLCIDPWSNESLVQNDVTGLVDRGSAQMDAEEALIVFETNLLPYNANHINYLRMPSTKGAAHYRARLSARTATFGTTNYRGTIAILHIDGNHSYDAAKADICSWSGFIARGGWMIVDDYIWPYGDGPRRAGDEFVVENEGRLDVAFVMGSALFIQLS